MPVAFAVAAGFIVVATAAFVFMYRHSTPSERAQALATDD